MEESEGGDRSADVARQDSRKKVIGIEVKSNGKCKLRNVELTSKK
jgi:hypothetical protein